MINFLQSTTSHPSLPLHKTFNTIAYTSTSSPNDHLLIRPELHSTPQLRPEIHIPRHSVASVFALDATRCKVQV